MSEQNKTTAVSTRANTQPKAVSASNTVFDLLAANKKAISSVIPKHLTPERMLRVAFAAINRVPKLMQCTKESLLECVMGCASLGLEPGLLGHAYLIPYKDKATLIIGYKGLIELARRTGQVMSISANNVYKGERFRRVEGVERMIEHEPLPPEERGDYYGSYAVARLKDGSYHYEFMWASEVNAIMETALGKAYDRKTSPWTLYTDEMRRKTALRRLAKYLPISVEFAKAAAIDEAHELGLSTDLSVTEYTVAEEKQEPKGLENAMSAKEPAKEEAKTGVVDASADEIIEAVKKAASAKGFNDGKLMQLIAATLGASKPVNELNADEAAKIMEALL